MSKFNRRTILVLKVLVAVYWAWVVRASLATDRSTFDAIIALSAPMLLSMHFLQALMFLRWLRGRGPWVTDFAQIMLFGVLHLLPRMRQAPTRDPR
jgi:uncharacterized protein YhhL (DUF1145 family)